MAHNSSCVLCTKRVHQSTIFQTFECSNESSTSSTCHFWNYKVIGFIQILHHCSVSWKITPRYFLAQDLYTLEKKSTSKSHFKTFEWLGETSLNSSCLTWNHKSVFLQTLHHSSVSWEVTLMYLFSWNFIWFGQNKPIKVENVRLSTAHAKFHQICTLMYTFVESI